MEITWLFGGFDSAHQPPSLDEGRSLSGVEMTIELGVRSSVASTPLSHLRITELSFLRKQESIDLNFHSWGWAKFAHERLL